MVRTAAGLPARGVEVKLRPQIRGTDLKVLGFNIGAQIARGSIVPAGRVFSLQATRLVSSTRRDRWAWRQNTAESRTPTTWPGSCGSGAPRPGWSRATRYTYHNERHPIGLLTICSSRPLPGSAPAWVKASRCPTHRLGGGDDGLLPVRSSALLSASEDISPLPPQGAIAREPGTRAPHVAVTFSGREISTIDLYGRRFVLLACWGRWRVVDLSC
jgi:putative polyketide hydroxylase